MTLASYFTEKIGLGILSTANDKGEVNAAVYAKPHVIDDETVAFIMRDRLTHKNLQSNAFAHYLFIEQGEGTHGIRLGLTVLEENQNEEQIKALSRRTPRVETEHVERFLVTFKVNKSLRLVGGDKKLL